MSGALVKSMSGGAASGGGGSHLDTQTVTTGASGSSGSLDRERGYINGATGSISDGTSNIYAGTPIDQLYWDENNGGTAFYRLAIAGAANSGWTTMTIDATALTRASATYSAGTWTWNTASGAFAQAFGAAGTVHTVTFD